MEHATVVDPIDESHQSDAFIRAYAKKQIAALNRDLDALREQLDFWRIACSSAEAYAEGAKAALAEAEAQLKEAQRAKAEAEHARDLECAKRVLKEKQTRRFKGRPLPHGSRRPKKRLKSIRNSWMRRSSILVRWMNVCFTRSVVRRFVPS